MPNSERYSHHRHSQQTENEVLYDWSGAISGFTPLQSHHHLTEYPYYGYEASAGCNPYPPYGFEQRSVPVLTGPEYSFQNFDVATGSWQSNGPEFYPPCQPNILFTDGFSSSADPNGSRAEQHVLTKPTVSLFGSCTLEILSVGTESANSEDQDATSVSPRSTVNSVPQHQDARAGRELIAETRVEFGRIAADVLHIWCEGMRKAVGDDVLFGVSLCASSRSNITTDRHACIVPWRHDGSKSILDGSWVRCKFRY
jgi:hypothetical protein